jgi:hypothetical protein
MVDLYPIPITTIPLERPQPQVVPVATIQDWARRIGNPDAHRRDMAGITVPSILVDHSALRDSHRSHEGTREFRYLSGTLTIYLRNRIFISGSLSPCEKRIWTSHEMLHVQDYEQLMGTLNLRLQSDSFMLAFFVDKQWFPENARQLMMDSIRETCARIFRQLTTDATARRDSDSEYERVRALVRETCYGRARRPSRRASDRASR